jgi:hypothetical protein
MMLLLALLVPWAANAQEALPYFYGFENNDLDAAGWTVQKTSSSTGISTSAKHEGSYGFQFHYSEQNAYLVSPVLSGTGNGVALSFYYKESTNSYGDEQFYVGYTTDETVTDPSAFTYGDITTASLSWELYEATLPAGTKKVAIKYVYNDALYLFLDDFTFEAPSACPKPSGLNVALTPGNGTVATLSWTSEATAWQICLNDDETNLIAATTNPFQLTGLTPETTYTAKVRANCGSEQSGWSNVVTFTPTNAYQITVNDGTSTNGYVPIYGFYVDAYTKSQFIIPAESLEDITWGNITQLTFYASNASVNWGNAEFEVYMAETDETTLSALADYSTMEKVMNSARLGINGNQMVVTLDAPYQYMGGNLMIGFNQTVTGSYVSCSWYGISATGASMGGYGSSINQQDFLPKTTFNYIPGEQPACPKPTHLAVDNIGPHTADLSWTSDANAWQIDLNGQVTNVTQNPYTLTNLAPETDYTVKVRANCGTDGYSEWSNEVSFTTEVACPAPTNFAVSDITAFSANVSWNAFSNVTLRYVANPNFFFQGFVTDAGAMADGADASWTKGASTTWGPNGNYAGGYYLADDFTVNTATSLTEIEVYGYQTGSTTESTFTGLYAMILSGNPMEGTVDTIWGDMTTNLMTSTSFTNCYRGSDGQTTATTRPIMAVTASGLNINLAAGTYWLVYGMTGTLSSGPWAVPYSDPVVGNTGDGLQYSSSGWAALTDSGSGPYGPAMKLNLGDIESFDWTTVNNISTGEYAMTNLNPETLYLVQVRANCGSEGNSNWVSTTFTTLPSCLFPTDLVVSDIEARQAVLAWTENGDATAWEVEVVGNTTTVLNATQNPYTLTGLQPETHYTVRVRSKCSNTDFSEWSLGTSFTTSVACPAPTNLTVSDLTTTSATLGWTSYNETFDVWYRELVAGGGYDFDNNSLQGWTTIDADGDGYDWVLGSECGGIYLAEGGSLAGTGHNASADLATSGSYSNAAYAALTPDNYLVSPQITLGGSITFWACAQDPSYAAEHFGVAVSTTGNTNAADFNTIQEWTMTAKGRGIPNVADCANNNRMRGGNRDQGTWYQYTVDLSEYSGQGYVAIRHFNCTDMFMLNVDDISIIEPGSSIVIPDWIEANEVANPYTIMGLAPETTYEVQVRSNCGGDDGVSTWLTGTFTTLSDCVAPWDLEVANITATTADLSWNGYKDSYDVRYYQLNTIFSADFESQLIPAEMVNDTDYPWTVTDTLSNSFCMRSGNPGIGNSTSAITMTATYAADGVLEFDAKLMGEGTSTAWDKCEFILDDTTTVFSVGAYSTEWVYFAMQIPAGEHTFTWSYSKDSSVNPTGDYFAVDNIRMYTANLVATVEEVTSPYTLTGLTPVTEYMATVSGHGCDEWSEGVFFTTTDQTTTTQTIALGAGANWCSFNVEVSLDDLKAALVAAAPGATPTNPIMISSQNQNLRYNGSRWLGSLTFDRTKMYRITVPVACEITVEGMPIDPASYPIEIAPGTNWIAYPLNTNMQVSAAFAGFAVNGDVVKHQNGNASYRNNRWMGSFEMQPGKGYKYVSAATTTKTYTFPSAK